MSPVVLPLAAITVMLWIIWSDSVRRRRKPRWFYYARALLFLTMTGVLLYNLVRDFAAYPGSSRYVVVAALVVSLTGAFYFVWKAIRPRSTK